MSENDKPVLIYATAPGTDVAERIGSALLDQRLAACINILPGMVSLYTWDGKRQRDSEVVMIIKTTKAKATAAIAAGLALHPYDTPAFLVLPVEDGAAAFMTWIGNQVA